MEIAQISYSYNKIPETQCVAFDEDKTVFDCNDNLQFMLGWSRDQVKMFCKFNEWEIKFLNRDVDAVTHHFEENWYFANVQGNIRGPYKSEASAMKSCLFAIGKHYAEAQMDGWILFKAPWSTFPTGKK